MSNRNRRSNIGQAANKGALAARGKAATGNRRSGQYTVTEEERALFRNSVGDMSQSPLQTTDDASGRKGGGIRPARDERPASVDNWRRFAQRMVAGEEHLEYRRGGVQRARFETLRRGNIPYERCWDLHGATELQAQESLMRFLADCQQDGLRCVLVVHGKGHRSKSEAPVLKNMLNTLLRQNPEVLAFCSARPRHGGTGAVYVLLRAVASS